MRMEYWHISSRHWLRFGHVLGMSWPLLCTLCSCVVSAESTIGTDFTSFHTYPEIKAPILDMTVYDTGSIAPGHIFLANYHSLDDTFQKQSYLPCQIGPHMYHGTNGELIWSGACLPGLANRNAYDFKSYNSSILSVSIGGSLAEKSLPKGGGLLLSSAFDAETVVHPARTADFLDNHEFTVTDTGSSAIVVTSESQIADAPTQLSSGWRGRLYNCRIQEVDILTGQVMFDWWSLDHVPLSESTAGVTLSKDDYLISARHTNTIYRLSGEDGRVVWRLSGNPNNTDFSLQDFTFSSQHSARLLFSNSTTTVLSFLDNASDSVRSTSDVSSALIVALDHQKNTARVLRRHFHPDGLLTTKRGNVQVLPSSHTNLDEIVSSNMIVGWSDRGITTEYDSSGKVIMRAQYKGHDMSTYRSYKFEVDTKPTGKPRVVTKCFSADGTAGKDRTNICIHYMAWNGASYISSWQILGTAAEEKPTYNSLALEEIATVKKTGFETTHADKALVRWVCVQALDKSGNVIGTSDITETEIKGSTVSGEVATFTPPKHAAPVPKVFGEAEETARDRQKGWKAPKPATAVIKDRVSLYFSVSGHPALLFSLASLVFIMGWVSGRRWRNGQRKEFH